MKFTKYIISIYWLLAGCAVCVAEDKYPSQEVQKCTDPRPEVCTQDYRPVCASLEDGSTKTFSNACTACSDSDVHECREGEC